MLRVRNCSTQGSNLQIRPPPPGGNSNQKIILLMCSEFKTSSLSAAKSSASVRPVFDHHLNSQVFNQQSTSLSIRSVVDKSKNSCSQSVFKVTVTVQHSTRIRTVLDQHSTGVDPALDQFSSRFRVDFASSASVRPVFDPVKVSSQCRPAIIKQHFICIRPVFEGYLPSIRHAFGHRSTSIRPAISQLSTRQYTTSVQQAFDQHSNRVCPIFDQCSTSIRPAFKFNQCSTSTRPEFGQHSISVRSSNSDQYSTVF